MAWTVPRRVARRAVPEPGCRMQQSHSSKGLAAITVQLETRHSADTLQLLRSSSVLRTQSVMAASSLSTARRRTQLVEVYYPIYWISFKSERSFNRKLIEDHRCRSAESRPAPRMIAATIACATTGIHGYASKNRDMNPSRGATNRCLYHGFA